ncbi:MAG: hypothetical protein WBA38_04075 [Gordonia sp. (in: high G+C Gram-positive bacteria)]|uniref:hypothetical protein n=1 Tax=Gordonia sp. (in: high G+C Gram-positive bacteria) TaxID=84139 RepID=UPI003C742EC5
MAKVIKLGRSDDHLVTLPIDLEDGGDVIEVTVPLLNWMPRPRVQEYDDWFLDASKKIDEIVKWEEKGKRGKAPHDVAELPTAAHHFTIRWLQGFCTEDEYKRIWDSISPGLAAEIYEALTGGGEEVEEIPVGESDASTDS